MGIELGALDAILNAVPFVIDGSSDGIPNYTARDRRKQAVLSNILSAMRAASCWLRQVLPGDTPGDPEDPPRMQACTPQEM